MAGDSQEKNLPASAHRLRKEREKGRVANSGDFVASVIAVAVCVWLVLAGPSLFALMRAKFDVSARALATADRHSLLAILHSLSEVLLSEMGKLLLIAAGAGLLANIAHKGGIVVSAEPLKPDPSRLNPAEGVKRMFSLRQLATFATSIVGLAIWFACVAAVIWTLAPSMLKGPLCGLPCVVSSSGGLLIWLLGCGLAAIALAGVVDLPLQVAFFRRDLRMSHQDRKQELKETEGSPEMSRFQQQEWSRVMREETTLPTVILVSASTAVGLRYHPQSAPIPVVVSKGRDRDADRIVALARQLAIPVHADPALSRRLTEDVLVGSEIPQQEFGAVAPILVRYTVKSATAR